MKYYAYKSEQRFESDVAYIRQQHKFIDYGELVRCRRHGDASESNRFLMTFDDGFVECFEVVRPILRRYGASGVFFISSDFIDNRSVFPELAVSLCVDAIEHSSAEAAHALASTLGLLANPSDQRTAGPTQALSESDTVRLLKHWMLTRGPTDPAFLADACERLGVDARAYVRERAPYMTASHLRQLVDSGFTVGAHGIAHRDLAGMSSAQVEHEIVQSCDAIRQLTGQPRVPFAFPWAGDGVDRTLLADILARYEFVELFFDSGGLRARDTFVVDRVWGDPPTGCVGDRTNLPFLLRRAWAQRSAWARQPFTVSAPVSDDRSSVEEPAPRAGCEGRL